MTRVLYINPTATERLLWGMSEAVKRAFVRALLEEMNAVTDEPKPTAEDLEMIEAKRLAAIPPEPVEGAEDLPDDVKDGEVDE